MKRELLYVALVNEFRRNSDKADANPDIQVLSCEVNITAGSQASAALEWTQQMDPTRSPPTPQPTPVPPTDAPTSAPSEPPTMYVVASNDETPAPTETVPEEDVEVVFTINGLLYDQLTPEQQQTISDNTAAQFSTTTGVSASKITVKLKPGSVVVDAVIQVPENSTVVDTACGGEKGNAVMGDILAKVKEMPGIEKATTGELSTTSPAVIHLKAKIMKGHGRSLGHDHGTYFILFSSVLLSHFASQVMSL